MNLRVRLGGLSSSRPKRSTNRPSYSEDTADTETEDEYGPPPSPLRRTPRSQRARDARVSPPPPSRRRYGADTSHGDSFHANTRPTKKRRISRGTSKPSIKVTKGKEVEVAVVSHDHSQQIYTGVIPPWQTLPYHVLFKIFTYASQPFYDKFFRPSSSINWLIDVATVCRSFHEPSLAALYNSPPLMPQLRSHKLVQFLSTPQENLSIGYANKIHRIELEVYSGLISKGGSHGYFDLSDLIKQTPQLKDLHLYNWNDRVMNEPGMTRSRSGRWGYPKPIFDALDETGIRLRSFEWNGSFSAPKHLTGEMALVHQRPSFQSLKNLTFVDFYLAHKSAPSYQNLEAALASTLAHLPELQRLKFQNCSLVNEYLLPKLPRNLEYLTFDNCDNLSSLNLRPFLTTHGSKLKHLVLKHNSSLNICFLTSLAESCPRLEVLQMDLHYFSAHVLFNDSEPRFDQLLLPSEIPTWPPTLQILEFNQLRKWESAAAETFFGSLLDSASDLKALRKLDIKAIVNIGWRDRASFRETWIGRLERVFLRQSSPPNDSMNSLTAYHERQENMKKSMDEKAKGRSQKRRSTRIAEREDEELKSASFPLSPKRSSFGSRPGSSKGKSSSQTSSPKRTRDHSPEYSELQFIQGMCDVVSIRIDNLRPAESQLTEADFLDSEASGDEEWNGKDPQGTAGYAW
jgi:hypothetical protein